MASKIDGRKLLAEVKANRKALDECEGPHQFEPHDLYGVGGRAFVRNYQCSRCGGSAMFDAAHWYEEGVAHGRQAERGRLQWSVKNGRASYRADKEPGDG